MSIKIPNLIIAKSFLPTHYHLLDGEGLVDADEDSGHVEQDEDHNIHNENEGKVEISLQLFSSFSDSWCTFTDICIC